MITQVIDANGKVYDLRYPEDPVVGLVDDQGRELFTISLSGLLKSENFRPYMIDGELAQSGLEPWERYSFPEAKERWKAVERIFTDNGFEVSHNGQDMFIRREDFENRIACEVVMNNPVTGIFGVEWDSYENWNRKQNI